MVVIRRFSQSCEGFLIMINFFYEKKLELFSIKPRSDLHTRFFFEGIRKAFEGQWLQSWRGKKETR